MPPTETEKRAIVLALLAALSGLVLLYSLLVVQEILLGVLAVGVVWLVYLFWKFVRTLGRIATALEARVEAERGE